MAPEVLGPVGNPPKPLSEINRQVRTFNQFVLKKKFCRENRSCWQKDLTFPLYIKYFLGSRHVEFRSRFVGDGHP